MGIVLKRIALGLILALWAGFALAQSAYRVQSGDRLTIEVLEDSSLNRTVAVLPDGRFSFPFAGTLPARGRTVSEVQDSITQAIASNFATPPTVFVSVSPVQSSPVIESPEQVTITVYIMGEVSSPGAKELEPGVTFLQALAQAGGLTQFAASKRLQVRTTDAAGNPALMTVNYKAISDGARMLNDLRLRDGDVILVPERRLFE